MSDCALVMSPENMDNFNFTQSLNFLENVERGGPILFSCPPPPPPSTFPLEKPFNLHTDRRTTLEVIPRIFKTETPFQVL
jgi:hypothetical protein